MAKTDFVFDKNLGSGSFGSVTLHKSKQQVDGKNLYYAVKTSQHESLFEEFEVLSKFRGCSRIIQCYGKSVGKILNDERVLEFKMLMEYADGGSLRSFMKRFKDKKLPEHLIKDFTRMLLEGLATIHQQGYVHCDIKPENILVFPSRVFKNGQSRRTYEVKISDFGLAKRDGECCGVLGTKVYMSPESLISDREIRRGRDLWALGCVVLEMYTGKRPWWHNKEHFLKDLIKCCQPLIPHDLEPVAKLFLMTCFAAEPDQRKDAITLMGYAFLHVDEAYVKKPSMRQTALKLERLNQMVKLGLVV